MGDTDDLSQLMPQLQRQAERTSPGNTAELRDYMRVLGERQNEVPAPSAHKQHKECVQLRQGTGRLPPKRFFIIKLRADDLEADDQRLPEEAAQLDPEELKAALVVQARQQRHAELAAGLRPGTGRAPQLRPLNVQLRPLPEPEAAAEGSEQAEEEVEEKEAGEQQQLEAATPGHALAGSSAEHGGGELAAPQTRLPTATQLAQLGRTPGASLFSRYCSPMEGVPERILLATRRPSQQAATATAARSDRSRLATPAGFTPQEGIPERMLPCLPLTGGPRQLRLLTATRVLSNGEQSVDSPVEGLVQQGAKRSSLSMPADAAAGFQFVPSPLEPSAAAGPQEFMPLVRGSGSLLQQPAGMVDAGAQTGLSLGAELGAAADPAHMVDAAAGCDGDFDDDAGGGFDDDFGYDEDAEPDAAAQQPLPDDPLPHASPEAELPGPSAPAVQQPARAKRAPTRNPGSRLRNELKRKSLANNPNIGMIDFGAGLRRSSRQINEPLKWWLNETKEFTRTAHRTMPTIKALYYTDPSTPWRTVTDPFPKRQRKKQRAPTPQELDLGGVDDEATESEGEEGLQAAARQQQAAEEQLAADNDLAGEQQAAADSDFEEAVLPLQPVQGRSTRSQAAASAAAAPPAAAAAKTKGGKRGSGGGRKRKSRR